MRKLTPEELVRESEIRKRPNFDNAIKELYGDSLSLPGKRMRKMGVSAEEDDTFDVPFDEVARQFPEADITDADGNAIHTTSVADILMNAEVVLPQGGDLRLAKEVWILMGR